MKILILKLLYGNLIFIVQDDTCERASLSERLIALRFWPSYRNRQFSR